MLADARYIVGDMLSLLEHLGYSDNVVTNRARAFLSGEKAAEECPASPLPSGSHQVDTSMESGPNNCFFCEKPMPSYADIGLADLAVGTYHPGDDA